MKAEEWVPHPECYDDGEMNLLALIIVFLAIVTAAAIAYVAWELSAGERPSGKPPPPGAGKPDDTGERQTPADP